MRGYRSKIAGGLVALALVVGCSEDEAAAVAEDQGPAADGQVMADAGPTPDGATPDAAVIPPAETVTLTLVNLLDADGVGALAGVSVCVLEYRAVLPCAAVEGEPAGAAVTVPKGEPFHIVFDSPDYEPLLAPFAALEEDFLVEGWPLVRRGTAGVAAGLPNV